MSEGMKGFKAEKKQHTAEFHQKNDEAARATKKALDFETMCTAAANVYAPLFENARAELRDGEESESIASSVTRTPEFVEARDAASRAAFAGNAYLKISFNTGKTKYELVYFVSRQPLLGMLAWRRDEAVFYFIGPGSRMSPAELPNSPDLAVQHFDSAKAAMLAG